MEQEGSGIAGRMELIKSWFARVLHSGVTARPVLVVVLLGLLAAALLRMDSLATTGMFQSDLPTPVEGGTSTASATPTMEVVLPVTATPVLTASLPAVTLTPLPTETIPLAPATVLPEVTAEPTAAAPTSSQPEPQQIEATPASASSTEERGRYPDEHANLRFRWRSLFDSLALGVSYLWLGCGILVAILLAGLFFLLWRKARHSAVR